jgi:hypothetical protein
LLKIFNLLKVKKKYIFLFLLIGIIFYRSPFILIEGRFMAEEGAIWFRHVFLYGNFNTLIFFYNMSGYLNLWMNIVAIFSNIPPIDYAPLISVYCALLVLIYIFVYIIFSTSSLLINFRIKCIGCIIILLSPVMTPEVWLSPQNSMSYFGVLTFLILFEKKDSLNFKKINPLILFLSGLSGPYSFVLWPLYYLKYFISKNRYDLINFLVIFACFVFQSLIFIYLKNLDLVAPNRFYLTYEKIINFIYNAPLKAFFGREFLQILISILNIKFAKIALLILTLLLLLLLIHILIKKKDHILNVIFAAFLIETILVLWGSAYKDFAGGRYSVVPGIIILFMTVRLFLIFKYSYYQYIFRVILIFSLTSGFLEFRYLNLYPNFLSCINCPIWKEEISIWKKDKKYLIKIWPYPKVRVQLY